jgi:hypothetical protein
MQAGTSIQPIRFRARILQTPCPLNVNLLNSDDQAVIQAVRETKLDYTDFPKACPYRVEQIVGEQ